MKSLSLDNGLTLIGAEAVTEGALAQHWDALAILMDDETREMVHGEGERSPREFLARYLALAPCDLVLG